MNDNAGTGYCFDRRNGNHGIGLPVNWLEEKWSKGAELAYSFLLPSPFGHLPQVTFSLLIQSAHQWRFSDLFCTNKDNGCALCEFL